AGTNGRKWPGEWGGADAPDRNVGIGKRAAGAGKRAHAMDEMDHQERPVVTHLGNIHSIDGHRNAVVRIATPRAMRPHEKNAERQSGAPATGRDPCRALLTAALVALPLLLAVRPVGAELRPGTVLGPDNWQEAKGFLPDEYLEAYPAATSGTKSRTGNPFGRQENAPASAPPLRKTEAGNNRTTP